MGFYRGPHTVTDGLVLSLDAGNTKSYPGSGTTWFDKSGNSYNGTLTNGPAFSSGSIVFDGSNDYVPLTGTISLGNTFTILSWVNPLVLGSTYNVYGCVANGSDNWFGIGGSVVNLRGTEISDVNNFDVNGTTTLTTGRWYQIAATVNVSTATVYLNGMFENSAVKAFTIGSWNAAGNNDIGRRGGINQNFFNGAISTVQAFNRVLTAQEILQNYTATKSRFGL
jgi:hypothetical protein